MIWPRGFTSAGVACGIKGSGALDLGLLVADGAVAWAGAFTRNAAAAAPVRWCRGLQGRTVRAVVVNSGNANACTGAPGADAVRTTASAAAGIVGCAPSDVLVASTGPIGVQLPGDLIASGLPAAAAALSPDPSSFAHAILTTDTVAKTAAGAAGDASVVGAAKGAAMLAPSMATMLAFLVTDAAADASTLRGMVGRVVARTFNRMCVDACESTNDSVVVLASGAAGEVAPAALERALEDVCADLALQMVRDAEGATRAVRVRVTGAGDDDEAAALGRVVASSPLWKAAMYGGDPNWGRVLAALGSAARGLDLDRVEIAIGGHVVFSRGEPARSTEGAATAMSEAEYAVDCALGDGAGTAEILTTDLSPRYVELNAHGST